MRMANQALLKANPIKVSSESRRQWLEQRGACVILSDDYPPSKYEASLIARTLLPANHPDKLNNEIARLILEDKRRFLPELAALLELARLKCFDRGRTKDGKITKYHYIRTKNNVGRALDTNQMTSTRLSLGIIVMQSPTIPCIKTIIRLCGYAGLGMVHAINLWQRACTPGQYMPWRSLTAKGRYRRPPKHLVETEGSPAYRQAACHFVEEIMGLDQPAWEWKLLMAKTKDILEFNGVRWEEGFAELGLIHSRFSTYWDDVKLQPKVIERPYTCPGVDRDDPDEFHGEDGD